jgi:hypothetical protein
MLGRLKPIDPIADAFLDDLVQADKGAAADEENLLGVDLDVFLVRMLAAALGGTLQVLPSRILSKRLLDAFAETSRVMLTLSVLRPILSISSM